jgi:cyclopropane-fatty-acyl-phospholipid synthase
MAKLAWHADSARVGKGSRVLDVGCGWGALLDYLVGEHQAAHVIGLTLSTDQAGYARANLPASAEVRLQDWRDYEPEQTFDAIVSIGAFEHFARSELSTDERRDVYRSFFDRCAAWLEPEGRLSLQSIGYEDVVPSEGPVAAFFSQEVFPESSLPYLTDIVEAAEPSFRVISVRNDGDHYSRTLELWQHRLEAAKDEAIEMVGRPTYRHYMRYLRVSRASFDRRDCTLYRLVLERRPSRLERL